MIQPAKLSSGKLFTIFLFIWGTLNLLQSFLTPLHNDEAYYWVFSRYPDWGYYDHPPMIAIMIRIGYEIFSNELGVRFLIVAGQIAALLIIWSLIDKEKREKPGNALLIVLVIALLPVFHMYGFLATPDMPLLLFASLVLFFYKRFLYRESWVNTFALGLAMAGLMYSKYHGGLMLILLILSNFRLLLSPRFIIAALFAVILFTPHIIWQINNNFPSLQYHLIDRVSGFDLSQVPDYLMNLLLIHNPFILPLFIWAFFKIKTEKLFERGLKFIIAGFILFFFAASFRYHVEPQWTALISVPLLILVFNHDHLYSRSVYLKRVFFIIFPVFLFARAALMFDFLPVSFLKKEFHGHKKWATEIEKIAQGRPVVFTNSYQDPSLYMFYSGSFAHTLNNKDYRKTQYDLWDFEEQLHGAEVCYIPHWLDEYYKSNLSMHITSGADTTWFRFFKDFQSLQRECIILGDEKYSFTGSGENRIDLKIFNPYPYSINLVHPELPVVFQIAFYSEGTLQIKRNLPLPESLKLLAPGDTIPVSCNFTIDGLPEGLFQIVICCETGILYDNFSSSFREAAIVH